MKTIEVGSFEAKNKLSSLLEMAERGQRIVITRRGKKVAMLIRPDDAVASQESLSPERILARFRAIRSAAGKGDESIRSMIQEGRKR